jgi:hypothetical protein
MPLKWIPLMWLRRNFNYSWSHYGYGSNCEQRIYQQKWDKPEQWLKTEGSLVTIVFRTCSRLENVNVNLLRLFSGGRKRGWGYTDDFASSISSFQVSGVIPALTSSSTIITFFLLSLFADSLRWSRALPEPTGKSSYPPPDTEITD